MCVYVCVHVCVYLHACMSSKYSLLFPIEHSILLLSAAVYFIYIIVNFIVFHMFMSIADNCLYKCKINPGLSI